MPPTPRDGDQKHIYDGDAASVGQYTIFEEVGVGGSSRVYLARYDVSKELCVLKVLRASRRTNRAISRALRESQLASQLKHPNIVRLVSAFQEGDMYCIAYEYIAGQTLSSINEALIGKLGMVPVDLACSIALKVLDALVYTHGLRDENGGALGIVHRDLSPSNVMISYAGDVKLIDFGAARAEAMAAITTPGMGMGTIGFTSPEQTRGLKVDHRSDLYSVGAILYDMLTGRPPVAGNTVREALGSLFVYVPPAPSKVNSTIRKEIDHVIMKALEKRPEDRWGGAGEMRDALVAAARLIQPAGPDTMGKLVIRLFPTEHERVATLLNSIVELDRARQELAHESVTDDITEPDRLL